jgi:RHS repeat-associated protein
MVEPGRKFVKGSSKYRYGFNGKEQDKETTGTTTYDYGFRIYNPALGRFLSVDPLGASYPWNSTYAFAENDVIRCIDLDGLEKLLVIEQHDKYGRLANSIISGIRDKELKTAIEMDMASKSGVRLAKNEVYLIRKKEDASISFEGNRGKLNQRDIRQIKSAKTVEGEEDESLPPNTIQHNQPTSRGNFYRGDPKDSKQNEFYEDQFPQTNATPINSGNKTVISNTNFISGTFNASTMNGVSVKLFGSITFSTVRDGIISKGQEFLAKQKLNVGFVESITLTVSNNNIRNLGQLQANLATQFNISRNSVRVIINPDIVSTDAGLPPGRLPPQDGFLHVDANYSGVSNGNITEAMPKAINR